MSKRLIVNADDYGRTPGVSEGILRAHWQGIVTSATAMINMPGIEESLAAARHCPGLGLGVHLCFTVGRPVLPPEQVPSLVDRAGRFYTRMALAERLEQVSVEELRAELAAQVERFTALAGRTPDHLDCHHFIHLYPPFFAVYLGLGAEYGRPVRFPFPPPEELEAAVAAQAIGLPSVMVQELVERDTALMAQAGVPHPDRFIARFFGAGAVTAEHLLSILDGLPEGSSELMTHPGLADEPLRAESGYAVERELELEALCDPRVRARVEELGIELVTFAVVGLHLQDDGDKTRHTNGHHIAQPAGPGGIARLTDASLATNIGSNFRR